MLKQRQRWRLHRPDSGIYADCARTAVACLLDLPRDDVPNFQKGIERWDMRAMQVVLGRARKWLEAQEGLTIVYLDYESDTLDPTEALEWAGFWNPSQRYLFCGGTRHEGTNHIACAKGSEIEWITCKDADIVSGYWPDKRTFGVAILAKKV